MFDEEKFFVMKKEKFIVCPNCKNDKNFKLIAVKIDHGIFEMKIGCAACDWISDDIYEDSGYYPDMTKDMIAFCVNDLHEQQARSRPEQGAMMLQGSCTLDCTLEQTERTRTSAQKAAERR